MSMQVILQEKIANLGEIGDQVKVKPGYARNFLIPFGKAVPATKENTIAFEARRADLEKAAAALLLEAQKRAEALSQLTVSLAGRASDEGKLFGSVGPRDVADAVTAAGVALNKSEVQLPEGPIRQLGEYDIAVQLHTDVTGTVKVVVAAE